MSENIRLTTWLRDKLRKALIATKFTKREKDLEKAKQSLALAIYEEAFSAKDRSRMRRLPQGWLPKIESVGAKFGVSESYYSLPKNKRVRVPHERTARHYGAPCLIAVEESSPLGKQNAAVVAEEKAIEQSRTALIREIDAVLHSVTTANKLIAVWPEITATVQDVAKTYVQSANLPAPRVDFLNKELGLTAAA